MFPRRCAAALVSTIAMLAAGAPGCGGRSAAAPGGATPADGGAPPDAAFSADAAAPGDGGSNGGADGATPGDPYSFAPSSRTVYPVAVFSTAGTVIDPDHVLGGTPTTLRDAGAQLVLDFGKEVGGILSLELAGASGNPTLGVAFSESSLYVGPNSDNSAGGGASDGALTVTVSGPASWSSDANHLRGGFRYVTLFLASPGSIDVSRVALAFTPDPARPVPNRYPNYFYSNDEALNRIWYAGAYTVQTNLIGCHQGRVPPAPPDNWDNSATVGEVGDVALVDGAKRDRTVWPGDLAISLPSGWAALGDTEGAKNGISTLFDHQHADGHLQWSGPPWNLDNGSDTYHLWTLHGVYLAWLYSGDQAWLDSLWSRYQAAMNYILGKIDGNGLLAVTATADWGPRLGQGGENIEANAILYAVLQGATTLATVENDAASASRYASLAASLRAAINARLWDASVGAYRDNPTSDVHPQDGNALAVWFGVIDDAARARGLSQLQSDHWNAIGSVTPEWGQISTFTGSMELMSHFAAGQDQRGLELMRTMWGFMLSNPNGPQSTFWESFTRDGTFASNGNGPPPSDSFTSLAHGWATGPTAALTFYVLGVAPDAVRGQRYHVVPHPGDLTHVEGRLTFAPADAVAVAYDMGAGCGSFHLTVDASSHAGSLGTVAVPTLGSAHTVTVDGAVAWRQGTFLGAAGVGGAFADAAYVYFTDVQPGRHTLQWSDGSGCPAAPERWAFCAPENGSCSFSGTRRLRYGAEGRYAYRIVDGSTGAVPCTSAAFGGDPLPNVVKACHLSEQLFSACAVEGGSCSFSGTHTVRFGANGQWITRTVSDGTPCTNAAFGGDPIANVAKRCEYR